MNNSVTNDQVVKYLTLLDQKVRITAHSGVEWRPEYSTELMEIDKALSELRSTINEERVKSDNANENGETQVPTMLTISDAAKRTGLSYEHIKKLVINKKIVSVQTGKKTLINYEKLLNYLNRGEQGNGSCL